MDIKKFVQIVSSFADSELDVDYEKGKLTAQIRDEIFEVAFIRRQGNLYCIENGDALLAGQWIIKKLGRFDTLARRILEYFREDKNLIPVS